jgi:hypothetical protein
MTLNLSIPKKQFKNETWKSSKNGQTERKLSLVTTSLHLADKYSPVISILFTQYYLLQTAKMRIIP